MFEITQKLTLLTHLAVCCTYSVAFSREVMTNCWLNTKFISNVKPLNLLWIRLDLFGLSTFSATHSLFNLFCAKSLEHCVFFCFWARQACRPHAERNLTASVLLIFNLSRQPNNFAWDLWMMLQNNRPYSPRVTAMQTG